jgi:hypothetical protein
MKTEKWNGGIMEGWRNREWNDGIVERWNNAYTPIFQFSNIPIFHCFYNF